MFYEEVFRSFNKESVDYLVAGGLALNLHGIPRATQDLDILPEMTEGNLEKIIQTLLDMGYQSQLPEDPMDFIDPEIRQLWIEEKNMKGFTLTHSGERLRTVDLLFNLPLDYSDCEQNVLLMDSEDLKIPVISINDLIKLKEEAGRDVDKLDLKMLKKLREYSNE